MSPHRKTETYERTPGSADVEVASTKAGALARMGRLVRIIRERHEWRQIDLAKRAGVASNTINGLEAGRKTHQRNIEKIAKALGTTAEALRRGRLPDDMNGLAVAAEILHGLTEEDLDFAYEYHNASTGVRTAVRFYLKGGRRDFTERLANLEPQRQADLLAMLAAQEDAQIQEFAATKKKING